MLLYQCYISLFVTICHFVVLYCITIYINYSHLLTLVGIKFRQHVAKRPSKQSDLVFTDLAFFFVKFTLRALYYVGLYVCSELHIN